MSGIVVGLDGSDQAQRALEWAMNEAVLRNTPLTVATVHQVAIDHWGLAELHYPQDEPARQRAQEASRRTAQRRQATLGAGKGRVRHCRAGAHQRVQGR